MIHSADETTKAVFSRFSPFIRSHIYKSGWTELREVQIQAAKILFDQEDHLILSSDTASGKTEAALFPILSQMEALSPQRCVVLYISPLKALINDQFSRMEELLRESALPVTRWHGDAGSGDKKRFWETPQGLLQITPESLESLLCRRGADIPRIFRYLTFIIIDEVHALMGSDRSDQILCQIQRIQNKIGHEPRRVALSATIGDSSPLQKWLSGGSKRGVTTVQIPSHDRSWKLGMEHYYTAEDAAFQEADLAIYRATKNGKSVIFSNSREETEAVCSALRSIAAKKGEDDRFYAHHGNLSTGIREEAERALKENDGTVTVCATATLELGIDIGKLKRIVQQEAPASVSNFLQRIGRSGRRHMPPEMLMIFREEFPTDETPIPQQIPWSLLQALAIVEAYRTEKWIEPPYSKPMPASLLFHQTLSVLGEKGGMKASALAKEILSLSPFSGFSKEEYKALLVHMLKDGTLEYTEDKEVLVGIKGEKILSGHRFFAVFKDHDTFHVVCGQEKIGSVFSAPSVGECFALAGRVWEVEEIDLSRRILYCKQKEGQEKSHWKGEGAFIHTHLLEGMKRVLFSQEDYPYLLPNGTKRLREARKLAHALDLEHHPLLSLGGGQFALLPWLGSTGFEAVKRILSRRTKIGTLSEVQSSGCYFLTFQSRLPKEELLSCIHTACSEEAGRIPLVDAGETPIMDKYDSLLPPALLCRAFEQNRLNEKEAKEFLSKLN